MFIIVKNAKARSELDAPLLSYAGTIGDVMSIPPAKQYDMAIEAMEDCFDLNQELGSTLFYVVTTGHSYGAFFGGGVIPALVGHFGAEKLENTLQIIMTGNNYIRVVYDTGDIRSVLDIKDFNYPTPTDEFGHLKLINRKTMKVFEKEVSPSEYFLLITGGQDVWTKYINQMLEIENHKK